MAPVVVSRGRLLDSSLAPAHGERIEVLAEVGGAVVEQILSGELDEPVDFDQDHDEWFVVLRGSAELEVNGERVRLGPSDWMLLGRRTPHRLVKTAPGTSWLALHLPDH